MSNPFEALEKIYNDAVEDVDKLGYSETWKLCTDLFFENVNKALNAQGRNEVHFSDVVYLDGYYIFGYGTNSVVHFHIDECPGWKFGIWWDEPSSDNPNVVSGQVFSQFEETLDKFKPSASSFCCTFSISLEGNSDDHPFKKMTEFFVLIQDRPMTAFAVGYCYWDPREHTEEDAAVKYREFRARKDEENHFKKVMDDKLLSWVMENIVPYFEGAEILDKGDSWSPRYELIAPYDKNKDLVESPGCYSWFADDDEEGQKLVEEYRKMLEDADEYGLMHHIWYFWPMHQDITFI